MTTAISKTDDPSRFDWIMHNRRTENGVQVFHIHTCVGDDTHGTHTWRCDSPYCEVMQEQCVAHGGLVPIRAGREPWRGR